MSTNGHPPSQKTTTKEYVKAMGGLLLIATCAVVVAFGVALFVKLFVFACRTVGCM